MCRNVTEEVQTRTNPLDSEHQNAHDPKSDPLRLSGLASVFFLEQFAQCLQVDGVHVPNGEVTDVLFCPGKACEAGAGNWGVVAFETRSEIILAHDED